MTGLCVGCCPGWSTELWLLDLHSKSSWDSAKLLQTPCVMLGTLDVPESGGSCGTAKYVKLTRLDMTSPRSTTGIFCCMSDTLRNGSWRTPWCATQIWWLSLMKLHEITPLRQSSCEIWQAFAKGLYCIVVNVLPAHKAANTFFETRRQTSTLHNVWGCLEGKVQWMLELRFKPFKPCQSLWTCELVEKLLWSYEVLNYVEVFLEKMFSPRLEVRFPSSCRRSKPRWPGLWMTLGQNVSRFE